VSTNSHTRATGRTDVTTYEPEPYEEIANAPRLVEVQMVETFSGDISATRAVTPGSYDITITDTAGGTKVCSNCVKVDLGTGVAANLTASSITHTSATLTWPPPTTGPTDINGYAVFVSADPHPTSTDSDITVTHSATDTHATVSALHPGTEYYVAVVTTTIAGPGDPACAE